MNPTGSAAPFQTNPIRTFGYVADNGDIPPSAPTRPNSDSPEDEEKYPINRFIDNDNNDRHDFPTVDQIRNETAMKHGYHPSSSFSSSSRAPSSSTSMTPPRLDDLYRTTYDTSKYENSRTRRRMITLLLVGATTILVLVGMGFGIGMASGRRPGPNNNNEVAVASDNNQNVATGGTDSTNTGVNTNVEIDEEYQQQIIDLLIQRVSHEEDLTTPDTAQNKALLWLTTTDDYYDLPSDASYEEAYPYIQRYIMAVLYYALNGPSWVNQCDFLKSDTSVCEWNFYLPPTDTQDEYTYGVQCNDDEEITDILLRTFFFYYC
jgi:hypothetical protein